MCDNCKEAKEILDLLLEDHLNVDVFNGIYCNWIEDTALEDVDKPLADRIYKYLKENNK